MAIRTTRAHPRGEARQAIADAARALFADRGYDGTSMRDVAQRAEVSEALLYRYFSAKTVLFEEAVISPYQGFVDEFLGTWERLEQPESNEEMVGRFVRDLYAFVRDRRDLLFALVAAHRFGARDRSEPGALSQGVRRLAAFTTEEAEARGLTGVDLEMAVSCTVAMVFAMTLLDDVLFPSGDQHPSEERLIREMSRFAAAGVQQRGLR
jgi:AcrR family transcriptional regulator